jgi:hypothetical protein
MSEHTPGPWEIRGDVIEAGGEIVCDPFDNRANARLIAAAPDLLEALKAIMKAEIAYTGAVEVAFEFAGPPDLVKHSRAAIAKAEGRS